MALLLVLGVMNLTWMAVLAIFVLLERLARAPVLRLEVATPSILRTERSPRHPLQLNHLPRA